MPSLGISNPYAAVRTLELHPFTGWHCLSHFHHVGPMPGEINGDRMFDVRSGPKGFFVDFDFDKPPKKKANEYRVILIGGSGAQGWGSLTNDHMLYKQLEKRLNLRSDSCGRRFRVINMAMAGSITYQNYIALNLWGHSLEPDLILSYSGRNDWFVPILHERAPDSYYHFNELLAMTYCSRGTTPCLGFLYSLFPNIMTGTNIGTSLNFLCCYDSILRKAKDNYLKDQSATGMASSDCLKERVIPFYISSWVPRFCVSSG